MGVHKGEEGRGEAWHDMGRGAVHTIWAGVWIHYALFCGTPGHRGTGGVGGCSRVTPGQGGRGGEAWHGMG